MPVNQKLKNYPVFSMKIIGMQILRLLVPEEVWWEMMYQMILMLISAHILF